MQLFRWLVELFGSLTAIAAIWTGIWVLFSGRLRHKGAPYIDDAAQKR